MLDKKHIKKQNKTQYVKTERDILAKCKHPNIIKLMSTFQDSNNLYYVLELAPNGELLTHIRQHKTLSMSCVRGKQLYFLFFPPAHLFFLPKKGAVLLCRAGAGS